MLQAAINFMSGLLYLCPCTTKNVARAFEQRYQILGLWILPWCELQYGQPQTSKPSTFVKNIGEK